jgi:hypothetical protein
MINVVTADDPNGFLYVNVIVNGPLSNSMSYVYSITLAISRKFDLNGMERLHGAQRGMSLQLA